MLSAHIEAIPVRTYGPDTDSLARDISVMADAVSKLRARIAGRIADQRALCPEPDGLGLTRWTALHGDITNGDAGALVGVARTMAAHGDTGAAIAEGSLSATRAKMLARAAQAHPELYERDEKLLLGLATDQPLPELNTTLRYWRDCADDEVTEGKPAADKADAAYLHASVTMAGMVRLDGFLDPETGSVLMTALDAAMPPPSEADARPAPNRRAHALGDICRQWLRNGTVDGGLRAAVSLVVDLDTIQGRHGRYCELDLTGPVDRATAMTILCDCDVSRVLMRGESEILDLGRATRTPSPAQRRALMLRDRHCRYRGCDRPPKWCDAHHVDPWALGGATDLDNLVLVCRHHHGLIHKGRATVVGGDVVPDVQLVAGRAPP